MTYQNRKERPRWIARGRASDALRLFDSKGEEA